jgi:hypothetical protein
MRMCAMCSCIPLRVCVCVRVHSFTLCAHARIFVHMYIRILTCVHYNEHKWAVYIQYDKDAYSVARARIHTFGQHIKIKYPYF